MIVNTVLCEEAECSDSKCKNETRLRIFSECVIAFGAAEKLCGRFISTTGLDLPDVDEVVSAFGAFLSDGGHGAYFLVFLSDYCDELLEIVLNNFAW